MALSTACCDFSASHRSRAGRAVKLRRAGLPSYGGPVKALPEGLDEHDLRVGLAAEWGFDAATLEYHAEGFGSYHWIGTETGGTRRFVTVDDLDDKTWLGSTRDATFDGLERAFDTAFALRHRADLGFVLAPLLTDTGETVLRIGTRHAMALYPIAAGRSFGFGERPTPTQRDEIIRTLVELHHATPLAQATATHYDLPVPGRHHLERALTDVDKPWEGGPFSEPSRAALTRHRDDVTRLLDAFDDLEREVDAADDVPVITHGEPHEGNIMRATSALVLVDWDTVGLALPERDLSVIDGITDDELGQYTESAHRAVNQRAMDLYRLRWDLGEITDYLRVLRLPHRHTPDTEHAWEVVDRLLQSCATL